MVMSAQCVWQREGDVADDVQGAHYDTENGFCNTRQGYYLAPNNRPHLNNLVYEAIVCHAHLTTLHLRIATM